MLALPNLPSGACGCANRAKKQALLTATEGLDKNLNSARGGINRTSLLLPRHACCDATRAQSQKKLWVADDKPPRRILK
jgi:hypothetical protein